MLKLYTILYRIVILIGTGLYILLMFATASSGYGNHPNVIEITIIGVMLLIFLVITIFQNLKIGSAKTVFRYLSAGLVLVISLIFANAMITAELSVELLFAFIIFSILSGLLFYELVKKRK